MDAEKEAELRRRVNANLQRLASGEVAREVELERENRAARKQIEKRNSRRIKTATKRLATCQEELRGLQEYMESMLDGEEDVPGMLDECDHAIDGCTQEIVDLMNELDLLRTYNVSS